MKKLSFGFGLAACLALLVMAGNVARDGGRYPLEGRNVVTISVETGWEREGMIPVVLVMEGLSVRLAMRADGRVYEDRILPARGKDDRAAGREIFRIDTASGRVVGAGAVLRGEVYERNALRTRMRLKDVEVAIRVAGAGRRVSLELAGMEIPVRAHLQEGADGVVELVMGEIGPGGPERLILDGERGVFRLGDRSRGKDLIR